ncbi:Blue-light-activated protein [Roseibaca ekhonensis]|uniref:histidine kinase n=1 Tax=Roseinatronobacter ekhonensis TaxID=254356 RepID=A0A3B0MZ84_9RHOB|nr:CHASE domain-containing protein [Roseibaca ekhonensis]SUZ34044.1 Blue-light-activated protein [Roseibaca ekhonensis]
MPKSLFSYGVVLAASLLAAVAAGLFALEEKRADATLEIQSARSELKLALATLSVRMASMATALERNPTLTPSDFTEIYELATRGAVRRPERALAFMPQVADEKQIVALMDQAGPDYTVAGYPEFQLFPERETEALFPAILVEPAASRSNVFGYNMGSSPERLGAARDALTRGVMTISAPVSLSQDTDQFRSSFLVLYPVYLPNRDSLTEATQAVLGAGITPAALFSDHVALFKRHTLEIEIGVAGTDLPVNLGSSGDSLGLVLTLVRDLEMPAIRTGGFDRPFRASAFYTLAPTDAVLPALAAALTALIGFLGTKVMRARVSAREALEAALARKEVELREAYRIQSQSQRREALGRLVGGVAHDFNNILSVILGNIELMKDEGAAEKDDGLLAEAEKATIRGARLTRQLLSIGRKSHLEPKRLKISSDLQDTASMLGRVLPESIEITTVPAAGLWPVKIDPDGLQNALLNLALNARDAMSGQGKLTIEASNTRITHDYLRERPDEEITPGRYVVVSVSDNGEGMTRDVIDRAFEPFFTTKGATHGSGLGLPSVLGFCRQSGGTCRIYSELGVGTTVRIWLPVDGVDEQSDDAVEATPISASNSARILLAEDEDGVARVLVQQLERGGYNVKHVATGDAAWEVLDRGEQFDLVVSDLVMPGSIQGAELARRLEQRYPQLKILLISGYPQEAAIEGNGVATRHPVLTKPIPRGDLLSMIETLLAGG